MTRGKIKRASVAIAAALLLGACSPAASAPDPMPQGDAIVIAGAIRPTADGEWHLIADDTHRPRGVEDVRVDADGNVVVEFTEEGSAVVTFVATPDETLSAQGYRMGASVRRDSAVLTISPALDYAEVGEWANVWVYGLLEP